MLDAQDTERLSKMAVGSETQHVAPQTGAVAVKRGKHQAMKVIVASHVCTYRPDMCTALMDTTIAYMWQTVEAIAPALIT